VIAQIHMLKLLAIFAAIIIILGFKRPLYQAMLIGIASTAILYQVPVRSSIGLIGKVLTSWTSMSLLVVLYLVTFLQRMLEARNQLKLAQQNLNGLFHNRRINASLAPLFIGLLPSAAAMILCGDIVKDATEGYLDKKEQAFVASWYRHIPESTLPTYSGVLLMSRLSGVPLTLFLIGMTIPVFLLAALGYFTFLRKLPKDPGTAPSANKGKDALGLLSNLWTLILILALILVAGLPVDLAVSATILVAMVIYRFRWAEIKPIIRNAFEVKLLINTFLVLVLKEFIAHSGLLEALPAFFEGMAIPMYLVFALLFFVGGIVSGANGIIAMGAPMAFAAIPGAGMPLMVLLMCMCHAASQISPTHVCLVIASDYFGVTLGQLVRKTLPIALLFCILVVGYYNLLLLF